MLSYSLFRDDPADQWRDEGNLLPLWKLSLPTGKSDLDDLDGQARGVVFVFAAFVFSHF